MSAKREKGVKKEGSDDEDLSDKKVEKDTLVQLDDSKTEKKTLENKLDGQKDSKTEDKLINLGVLGNPNDAIISQVGKMDMVASHVRAEAIVQENKAKLFSNLKSGQAVMMQLNNWRSSGSISGYSSYKIVKSIPRLVNLRVNKLTSHDTTLLNYESQGWSQVQFINDSINMFSGNALLLDYYIDSVDTFTPISFIDDVKPVTSLKLDNFVPNPMNANLSEDHSSKLDVMCGLLELIFAVRRAGDVFIQGVRVMNLGNLGSSDQPVDMLRGSKIPDGMCSSVYIGVTGHELQWFKDDVTTMFSQDDFVYGETSTMVFRGNGAFKAYSYYGVTTDSIFATLHHIAMEKFDAYKISPLKFDQLFSLFSPLGGSVLINYDVQMDFWDVEGISRCMIDQYRFVFLISPDFRSYVYSKMIDMTKQMKMLLVIPDNELLDVFNASAVNMMNNNLMQDGLVTQIRRFGINHFYEAFNMELFHAFLSPSNPRPSSFNSYQHAALALLSIGLDALYFPNMFWSNIGLNIKAIYDAIYFLDIKSFQKLMKSGFAPDTPDVKDLDKLSVLRGIVPYIFNPSYRTSLVSDYMDAISPVGRLTPVRTSTSDISPNMNNSAQFYLPWTFSPRPAFGYIGNTPLAAKITVLISSVCAFIAQYAKKFSIANAESGSAKVLLNSLAHGRNKVASSVMHFEVNILMNHMLNMPWIPYFTYTGGNQPNLSPLIGIKQFASRDRLCIPANDTAIMYPHGIGLWTLMSIHGEQLVVDGRVKEDMGDGAALIFPDPVSLYKQFDEDVRHCVPIGEAYGFMSYILNASELPDDPFSFLFNVLGSNLKAGTASQILGWLLPDGTKPFVTYLDGTQIAIKNPDQRLKDPAVTKIDPNGHPINPSPGDHSVFKRKLELLDEFEVRKFRVALTVLGNQFSPLHKISMGLTFGYKYFENLSPLNRHDDDVIDVNYEDGLFGIRVTGERSTVTFTFQGQVFVDVNDVGFPFDLRVVVKIPSVVTNDQWNFMKDCIKVKRWQLFFPNQLYVAKVQSVTFAQMKSRPLSEESIWNHITTRKYGELIDVTFYDTSYDVSNPRMEVVPKTFVQYLCAVNPVQRNILLKNMFSLTRPNDYIPPQKVNWEIGMKIPTSIPMDVNGVQKYLLPYVNFNNYLRVYTNEVSLNEYPKAEYYPPVINDLNF